MLLYCQYETDSLTGYCNLPAEKTKNKGYDFLCRAHNMALDGRSDLLRSYGRRKANRVRRVCPVCHNPIWIEPYRTKSRLNFCSWEHRSQFYHPKGVQIGANKS